MDRDALERTFAQFWHSSNNTDAPILCGSFGCITSADPQVITNWTNDVVSLFKQYGISYTYWNYKNLDFGLDYFTQKYPGNPNYANAERLDEGILAALQSGSGMNDRLTTSRKNP